MTDDQIIDQWLHGRSAHTQRAYRNDLKILTKPLSSYTLSDLQKLSDDLAGRYSAASRRRIFSAIKSLFAFARNNGYLSVNVAAALRVAKPKDTLAERILSEAEVSAMIDATEDPRNRTLLVFLYASAGRVSEVCRLKWRDVRRSGDAVLVTFYGKGSKTRVVRLNGSTWPMLQSIRVGAADDSPVFASSRGGSHLDTSAVWRIVRAAAQHAGIDRPVSPHWLRHSHATHALDHGAKLPLLSQTLGHAPGSTTIMRYLHVRPDDSSSLYLTILS